MRGKITTKQIEYLEFIKQYKRRKNYSPTLKEIAMHFEVKTGTAQVMVRKLIARGYLTKTPNLFRSLVITKKRYEK